MINSEAYAKINDGKFPPTPEQEQVIVCEEPGILVIAGAGSGKTKTMADRIAYHVAAGNVQPGQVLGLTFTNKAAGELKERVTKRLHALNLMGNFESPEGDVHVVFKQPTISTYNSFASDIASTYGVLVGADPSNRLMTEADRYSLMRRVIQQLPQSPALAPLQDISLSSAITQALTISDGLINNGVSLQEARIFCKQESAKLKDFIEDSSTIRKPRHPKASLAFSALKKKNTPEVILALLQAVEKYHQVKKDEHLSEFADQVSTAAHIVEKFPFVAQEISSRYRLVLLDEYQDTDVNQARFLIHALTAHKGENLSITAVGDPNQAIYGWRGASASALENFAESMKEVFGGVQRLHLSTAFRNDKAVLVAGNAVTTEIPLPETVEDTPIVHKMKKSSSTVLALEPRKGAGEGIVRDVRTLMREESYRAIARRILDVYENVRKENDIRKAQGKEARGAEIAVLCRKRSQFDDVVNALHEADPQHKIIRYEIIGGESLVKRPEIITLRALLSAANNPARGDALARLITYWNIGVRDIRELARWAREYTSIQVRRLEEKEKTENTLNIRDETNMLEALDAIVDNRIFTQWLEKARKENRGITEEGVSRLEHIARALQSMRRVASQPLADQVKTAITLLGLDIAVSSRSQGKQRVQTSIEQFVAVAREYGKIHATTNSVDFINWLDIVEEQEHGGEEEAGEDVAILDEEKEVNPGVVQIMTIHASKGLEWKDLVVIPDMVTSGLSTITERVKAWPQNSGVFPYPLRSDYEYLGQFRLADMTDKKETASQYAEFKDYLCWKESEEARRLAYVAFTRASKELMLVGYAFKDLDDVGKKVAKYEKDLEKLEKASTSNKKSSSKTTQTAKDPSDIDEERRLLEIAGITAEEPSVFLMNVRDECARLSVPLHHGEEHWEDALKYQAPNSFSMEQLREIFEESVLHPSDETKVVDYLDAPETLYWPHDNARSLPRETQQLSEEEKEHIYTALRRFTEKTYGKQHDENKPPVKPRLGTTHEGDMKFNEEIGENAKKTPGKTSTPEATPLPGIKLEREYYTASDIVGLSEYADTYEKQLLRPIPLQPSRAARLGTLLHAKIAESYDKVATLDIDFADEWENEGIATEKDIEKLWDNYMNSEFSTYPPLGIEEAMEIVIDGKIIRCTIDAVLDTSSTPDRKNITIVDWKTGRRPDEKQLASRELQLALYRLAWARTHNIPIEEIDASFIYLKEKPEKMEVKVGKLSEKDILSRMPK